ncbi:MAG: polyribonucleotide nucleotidyltransferase, partial [Endozoicomonadaceae bacterium]|nr:polyribonucleotide nucleotidyltransferase [Endozoicomonadaceae bacterium]
MNPIKKSFSFGSKQVHLETGRIARQADASVMVTIDEICVLVTVVASKKAKKSQDFFPLSVHYQERAYAAGKIPGGFIKREGRISEKETLTSRLIDRPVRPLFPKDFMNEVQIICSVLSSDKKNDPDIAAMIGVSAALSLSGIPFQGPLAAARVGFNEEEGYLLNPSYEQLASSTLDMVVAGTKDAIMMVESEASELSEDKMLGAVLFAKQEYQCVIDTIHSLVEICGRTDWKLESSVDQSALTETIMTTYSQKISEAYQVPEKAKRNDLLQTWRDEAVKTISSEDCLESDILKIFSALEKKIVRNYILDHKKRIDGRDLETVRPISIDVDVLPATHGSALFTRGETQALAVVTLGSTRDAQQVDSLEGEKREPFMLHYNFPPYSVGECGRLGPPGRREIGHGRLARRGIQAVLPSEKAFPYTIRVVSEITESNGSSSMASVCGSSLALMDAGVPLKAPVAG